MKIFLRPATSSDVPVLQRWDRQPHVLQARNLTSPELDWDWRVEIMRSPSWRELLIGEIDGRPVAFIQIIDPMEEDTHYWGTVPASQRAIDIWIGERDDLGKGYGTLIMQLALDRCFKDPSVQNILIDPLENNIRALQFYERLGFGFVEQRMFGDDPCFVYQLSRPAWKTRAEK